MGKEQETRTQIEKSDSKVDDQASRDLAQELENSVDSRRKTRETDDTGFSGDYD